LAEKVGALEWSKNACNCLYKAYKTLGQGNDALPYLEKYHELKDSLQAEETDKQLQQMEFDKRLMADSLKREEKKLSKSSWRPCTRAQTT
jgi:adenylate cyclase